MTRRAQWPAGPGNPPFGSRHTAPSRGHKSSSYHERGRLSLSGRPCIDTIAPAARASRKTAGRNLMRLHGLRPLPDADGWIRKTMTVPFRENEPAFAARILQKRAARFLRELSALKRKVAEGSIHDTRVWSRRTRAALETFRHLFPENSWRELFGEIRRVTRILGAPREAEVMVRKLRELGDAGDMAEGITKEHLQERLQKKVARQAGRMMRKLRGVDARALRSRTSALFAEAGLLPAAGNPEPSPALGRRRARARAQQPTLFDLEPGPGVRDAKVLEDLASPVLAFKVARSFQRASDERLHRLRIAVKKLRYGLEIFDESAPGSLAHLVTAARHLQEAAGEHQDWRILCERLSAETTRLTRQGANHLAYQTGRLLEHCRARKMDAREGVLPALLALQSALGGAGRMDEPVPEKPKRALRTAGE